MLGIIRALSGKTDFPQTGVANPVYSRHQHISVCTRQLLTEHIKLRHHGLIKIS